MDVSFRPTYERASTLHQQKATKTGLEGLVLVRYRILVVNILFAKLRIMIPMRQLVQFSAYALWFKVWVWVWEGRGAKGILSVGVD